MEIKQKQAGATETSDMEAEMIENSNRYRNDNNLLIQVGKIESDVQYLQTDMARIETDMKAGFAKVDTNMKASIAEVKVDMRRLQGWIIAMMITLMAGMLGVIGAIIGTSL